MADGIRPVERPGLGRGTLAMKVAAGAMAIVLTVVAALAPQMAFEWRAALVALGVLIALVLYLESEAPSRHKKDHLMFWLDAPADKAAASIKAFLERNRISNSARKQGSVFGEPKTVPGVILLESLGAELFVVDGEKGAAGRAMVIAGPVGPENSSQLQKLLADLKTELYREFLSRAA